MNPANLNTTLNNIKSAHLKEDAANDFINGWTRKFQKFFDRRNTSPSKTDPILLETNTPQNSNTTAMIQVRLNLDATIGNLDADKQQVLIAANKSFVKTTMEESLPEIVREASQNLFAAPPALQPPLLPCLG
jgi:hypothetical protein